ncbi:MAG: hypothetical protein QS721_06140 [Candidatus Endonucleobacter sp. (ex Gigantidas childressi)]|nr:hypothetical protein [Candidatus Endonucleobacter sp. (ex Gigantidas childressi)]
MRLHPNNLLLVGSWGSACFLPIHAVNDNWYIPIILEGRGLLTAFDRLNRLVFVGSWSFARLSPTPSFNSTEYRAINVLL